MQYDFFKWFWYQPVDGELSWAVHADAAPWTRAMVLPSEKQRRSLPSGPPYLREWLWYYSPHRIDVSISFFFCV